MRRNLETLIRYAGLGPSAAGRALAVSVAAGTLMLIAFQAGAYGQAPVGDPAGEYAVRVGRLKYGGGGDWYADPSSIPNWLGEFERRTGVPTNHEEKVVSLADEDLRAYPFLYMTGHGTVRLAPEELSALRRYLEAGGFLYANDNYGIDKSFRAMVRQLFPEEQLRELPNTHPIYHCFYDLPGLPKIHEHDGKPPQGFGITVDDRLVLFYTYESDIGDGLEDPEVHNDPPEKRELAMKMAVNVLMYAIVQNALTDTEYPLERSPSASP